jgi:hypothetical protein
MPKRFNFRLLKLEPESYIVITKLDAATRQLHTAIELWFREGDPVSIHSLISAAMGILAPIAEDRKTWKGTYDTTYIRPGLEEEYLALMKVHQNFFKHGSKDPDESIKFNPEANLDEIRVAIEVLLQISPSEHTPLMSAFCLRFFLTKPEIHNSDPYPLLGEKERIALRLLPKKKFLSQVMPT